MTNVTFLASRNLAGYYLVWERRNPLVYLLFSYQESDDEEEDRRLEQQRRKEKEQRKEEQEKYRGGSHTLRTKSNKKDDDGDRLDPMDPAAYSDVPRYVNWEIS